METLESNSQIPTQERRIIFLIGSVQFVNVLDFMMVMPMGPDFAQALAIPTSKLGQIGGSYTAAACVAGLIGSLFLDRFDRRKALFVSMLGLALGTVAGGFAQNFTMLMAARVLAGLFGGPATSLALSIIADTVPPHRRGMAMGKVMGAFSIASILGVPAGLELARLGGWRLPFFAVGALAALITFLAVWFLPPMRGHLARKKKSAVDGFKGTWKMLTRKEVFFSYSALWFAMLSAFLMIPNFSTFFQLNLGFPRDHLGSLYLAGGVLTFFTMRAAGWLIDRFNAYVVVCFATVFLVTLLGLGYILVPTPLPPFVMFTAFMVAMSTRNVSLGSLSSRVPHAAERASFMSFQSATQHFASALGAIASSRLLTQTADGKLVGMPQVAALAITFALLVPFFVRVVQKRVKQLAL